MRTIQALMTCTALLWAIVDAASHPERQSRGLVEDNNAAFNSLAASELDKQVFGQAPVVIGTPTAGNWNPYNKDGAAPAAESPRLTEDNNNAASNEHAAGASNSDKQVLGQAPVVIGTPTAGNWNPYNKDVAAPAPEASLDGTDQAKQQGGVWGPPPAGGWNPYSAQIKSMGRHNHFNPHGTGRHLRSSKESR